MQQDAHPALSYGQEVAVTVCFVLQCLIFCPVALLTTSESESDMSPKIYLPVLYLLAGLGPVVGIIFVLAMWRGLNGLSLEHWADCELFTMLLWSVLIEVSVLLFNTE